MTMTIDDARGQLAELEEAIRDGADVTAAQLAKARDAAALADLRGEADARARARAEAEQLEQRRAEVRADAAAMSGLLAAAREAFDRAADAAAGLVASVDAYQDERRRVLAAARRYGIVDEVTLVEVRDEPHRFAQRAVDEARGRFEQRSGHVVRHPLMTDERYEVAAAGQAARRQQARDRHEADKAATREGIARDAGFDTYAEYKRAKAPFR